MNTDLKNQVKTILAERGLKLKDIHEELGVSYRHLSAVLNGKYPISVSLAKSLEKWACCRIMAADLLGLTGVECKHRINSMPDS